MCRQLVLRACSAWAIGLVLLAFAGCEREKPKPFRPETKTVPPAEYMKDPAFREKLKGQVEKRKSLAGNRQRLQREMEAKVDAMKAKMPGAADAAVLKELEKDAEWNSLVRRMKDVNQAHKDNRRETMKAFRERILPGDGSAKKAPVGAKSVPENAAK